MIRASVYIVALNEEANIARALESVKEFEDIVVIDSGSVDKTKELSSAYTDNIIYNEWINEFQQRDFALSQCQFDWVLSLDADEEISPELLAHIRKTVESDKVDGLDINIREYFMGKLPGKGVKLTHRVKFFRKSKFNYGEARVHIPQFVDGKVVKAKGYITHFGAKSVELAVMKNNKYSSLSARDKFEKNKRPSRLKIVFIFPIVFFKYYLLKRHCLSGIRGFVLSINCAHYALLKEAKLYELDQEDSHD
ncbi:MAG: glycosyltransferase family 2 protein [Hellea sp.]|nr:glycosyltransferase family 2 protein [Hellea sp.]